MRFQLAGARAQGGQGQAVRVQGLGLRSSGIRGGHIRPLVVGGACGLELPHGLGGLVPVLCARKELLHPRGVQKLLLLRHEELVEAQKIRHHALGVRGGGGGGAQETLPYTTAALPVYSFTHPGHGLLLLLLLLLPCFTSRAHLMPLDSPHPDTKPRTREPRPQLPPPPPSQRTSLAELIRLTSASLTARLCISCWN